MSDEYWKLLRHPNWQRKRLEVMERAEFQCEECGTTETTLNVHHTYYERGKKPWEYPSESLKCLCEKCHKDISDIIELIKGFLSRMGVNELRRALGYTFGLESRSKSETSVVVGNNSASQGLADAFGLELEQLIAARGDDHKVVFGALEASTRTAEER